MMFIAMAFMSVVLIGAPLAGLFWLALSLILRWLHRRYLKRTQDVPPKKWRRVLSIVSAVLAALCLLAGAAGWAFFLWANMHS